MKESNQPNAIDPNSSDFTPLFTSVNGAAVTPAGQGEDKKRYDHRKQTNTKGNFISRAFPFNLLLRLVPKRMRLLLRIAPSPSSLTSSELSFVSSMSICFTFFTVILLSGFISASFGGINGHQMAFVSTKHIRTSKDLKGISSQGVGLAPPVGTRLPSTIREKFADVSDQPLELMDTAIFWHVPRSAGTTIKHVLATCLGKAVASEAGGLEGHHLDERLELLKRPQGLFLNVDTTTQVGLRHAKSLGLVQSKMADVVVTPYIQEAAILFDKNHKGRFFTMLREPVERIQSLFYYRRVATWEKTYDPRIKDLSLLDFVLTSGEENWMVRTLTGYKSGPLEIAHLNAAKEILRSKFLIGLLEDKTESFRRFEEYFGWKFPSPVSQTCKNSMYYFEWHSGNPHPSLEKEDQVYKKIITMNEWDVALYEYAQQLFQEQQALFWNMKDGSELTWGSESGEEKNEIEEKKNETAKPKQLIFK